MHNQISPKIYKGVMVSSTFTDLSHHRIVLIEAINSQSLKAIAMEYDSAKPAVDIIESSLNMVKNSAAYIGVISHKYGQIPICNTRNPDYKSLTELEYDEAQRLKRPILVFIMGDNHSVKPIDVEKDPEKDRKLKAFRERVRYVESNTLIQRIYKEFNDINEFTVAANKSVAELYAYLEQNEKNDEHHKNESDHIPYNNLYQTLHRTSIDNIPANGITYEDLEEEYIQELLKSKLANDLTSDISEKYNDIVLKRNAKLRYLGCMVNNIPSIGAFYCFGKHESFFGAYSSIKLQMSIHYGENKGGDKVTLTLASGNLISLYKKGMQWLSDGIVLKRIRIIGKSNSDDTEIPEIIIREALVNALIHRDYSRVDLKEQPTRIDVFNDFIEITSYGGLPNGVSLEKLNSPNSSLRPFRRNPIIAQIFQCLNIAELNASGIERMQNRAISNNLRTPLYRCTDDYVCIKLFRPTNKISLFVSGHYIESVKEREVLFNLVNENDTFHQNIQISQIENKSVADKSFLETNLSLIDRCDILVFILGNKMGYKLENGVSFLELEYNRAKEIGKPIIVFLKGFKDTFKENAALSFANMLRTESIVTQYESINDFKNEVSRSIINILANRGLIKKEIQRQFDINTALEAKYSDISMDKVDLFISKNVRGLSKMDSNKALEHLNLINSNGISNEALLLFGFDTYKFFPNASIKIVQFEGNDFKTKIVSRKDISGDLFQQVSDTFNYIFSILLISSKLIDGIRNEDYEIPQVALREVILNAITHRDYSSSASIQISIFKNRIEIWNPGKLPSEISIVDLKREHISFPRNPLIAEVFYLSGFVERFGTGTLDIIRACKRVGLKLPIFQERNEQFGVILWKKIKPSP